jgi:HEPN domain-containing protein
MTPRRKTVATARAEAHLYLGKARQFLEESRLAAAADRSDACLLNAVHAAISAVDAATTALAGRRSADPDHTRAADLLEEIAGPSDQIRTRVTQLRMLLGKKNAVEYESRRASAKEAAEALDRATRLVDWAGEVVRRAPHG